MNTRTVKKLVMTLAGGVFATGIALAVINRVAILRRLTGQA